MYIRKNKNVWIMLAVCLLAGIIAVKWNQHTKYIAANTAYIELLRSGVTEHGIEINYFAYLDLEKDGVPELLVSDCPGTENDWSTGTLYGYEDGLVCYGTTSTRFDYFYLANDMYLLAKHRMGAQFFSRNEKIITVAYHTESGQNQCAPAVQINDGNWIYLTDEEFAYYNRMPEDDHGKQSECFVRTAIPVELQINTMKEGQNRDDEDDNLEPVCLPRVFTIFVYSLCRHRSNQHIYRCAVTAFSNLQLIVPAYLSFRFIATRFIKYRSNQFLYSSKVILPSRQSSRILAASSCHCLNSAAVRAPRLILA